MPAVDSSYARRQIDVVLVSYNTRQMTLDCLASVSSALTPHDRIIVVDNASHDGSTQAISAAFPHVCLINNEQNLGFGAANNLAFENCRGDYVLLLNTDTIVRPGAIEAMIDVLDRHATVGAAGCRLENADGSLQRSCWSFPSPLNAWTEAIGLSRLGLLRDWHRWDHSEERDVDFVIGAALLVRRRVIEEVGNFDECFFLYAEETDWQKRMHKSGWRVRYTPSGTIMHLGGGSGDVMKERQVVEFCRSNARYIHKHYGPCGLLSVRLAKVCGLAVRVLILSLQKLLRRPNAKENYAEKVSHLRWWLGLGERQGFSELANRDRVIN